MKRLMVVFILTILFMAPSVAQAEAPDFDVPGGHFYTQATSDDGTKGFAVVDDAQARFWSEFKRLGGVSGVGYPLSQRFTWDGFTVQVMQKGVLQWRPEVGQAYFVNVFDQMSAAGKDEWLEAVRSTPKPLPADFDANKSWPEVIATRLALLDANPAIKAAYNAAPDPINLYGLPTSRIVDNGNHYVIRLQRATIQQWKEAVPWAAAGQVTIANGGDVGREAGLYPGEALQPSPTNDPNPTSRGGERPNTPPSTPESTPQQEALDITNQYRAIAGAPPLSLSDALNQAAGAHANYYVQNYGSGMAGMGLHYETLGRPGFTGVSWAERARAAGYNNWAVDENVGLVGDPRRMIDWCMATINHRWNLIHPSAVHLGYGIATGPKMDVLDIGFSGSRPDIALPTVYPGDGQQGVPTSSSIAETPDPAPGVPRPLGFPLTISFHIRDNVQFSSYSLTDDTGQSLQLYTSQKNWLRSLALIPARPLASGKTYTASVSGTVNGQPFTKTWSFTTQ